ncbi:MAG: ATP-dependent DNA helicase [Planctomycetota bacterium]|nr:ATP-dependent DNA helicase [Planctomycetota bacterium]
MPDAGNWRDGLTDEQREAAEHTGTPLAVLAGPGTGKTRVIIARIRRILEDGADPTSVLALTFSVKATEEMRGRLVEALGERVARALHVQTFHSFGRSVLRRFGDMADYRSGDEESTILDSAQTKRLLRSLVIGEKLFPECAAGDYEQLIPRAKRFICSASNAGRTPREAAEYAALWTERAAEARGREPDEVRADREEASRFAQLARLWELFDAACRRAKVVTFEDFIARPVRLMREKAIVASILRSELKHVLVDEFQDVNAAQIALLREIAPAMRESGRPSDLCVVGDDDQAIYGFRGSDTRAFGRFAEGWPGYRLVSLTKNFRSVREVVRVANSIILKAGDRFAPDKRLEAAGASQEERGAVEGVLCADDGDIPGVVASLVMEERGRRPGQKWGDFCVIVRTNNMVDEVASGLLAMGVPADVEPKEEFEDEPGAADLMAWLRLLADPSREREACRLLSRPPFLAGESELSGWVRAFERAGDEARACGFATWLVRTFPDDSVVRDWSTLLARLRHAAATEPAEQLVETVLREAGLVASELLDAGQRSRRIERFVRVLRFARRVQPRLEPPGDVGAFVRYFDDLDEEDRTLRENSDELERRGGGGEPGTDAVRVITAHRAKGLEFDTVIVARVRPGRAGFPCSDGPDEAELPAEFTGEVRRDGADEERRLFYVASTRAARRLLLVAKAKKNIGKVTDYFDELTKLAEPGRAIPVRQAPEAVDVSAQAALLAAAGGARGRGVVLVRELDRLRQEGLSALRRAERARSATELDAVAAELRRTAATIAGLGRVREARGEEAGAEALFPEADGERVRRVSLALGARPPAPWMTPPLKLSFSAVDSYLRCPRCFFLAHVRRLPEQRSSHLEMGGLTHEALEKFGKERRDAESEGRRGPGVERLKQIARQLYRERWPASRPYSEERLSVLLSLVENAGLFDDGAQLRELEWKIQFPYPAGGHEHVMTAKIDRVDELPDGRLRLVDYKTSKESKKLLEPAEDDLQMCIYAMALARSHFSSESELSGVAEYWLLQTGKRGSIDLRALKLDKARRKIDEAIEGMLRGDFERGRGCNNACAWMDGYASDAPGGWDEDGRA